MQKGMELPLNAIIVVAIAVLVLVALFAFFGTQFFSSSSSVDVQKVFASGCTLLRNLHACDHGKVNDITIDGVSLGYACSRSGFSDTVQCARACGCSVQEESGQALSSSPPPSSPSASQGTAGNQQSQNVDLTVYYTEERFA